MPQLYPDLDQTHGKSPPHPRPQGVANQQSKQPSVGPERGWQQHLPCKHHLVCFSIKAGPEVQALQEKGP